ncbi:hypothetical protein AMK59_447, partial [Oryctes borbonicus]
KHPKDMMKLLLVFMCSVSIVISQISSDDAEKIKQASKGCIGTVGLDTNLVKSVKEGDIVDDPKVKEFLACVLKKLGMVNEDGSFNNNVIRTKMPEGLSEDEKQNIVDKCLTLQGSNVEDTVWRAYKCYREKSRLNLATNL